MASLIAAGGTWGSDWAPRNPIRAARKWCRHVKSAQRVARDTPAVYREIRYEAIRAEPATELEAVARWLGLGWDRRECEAMVDRHEFSKLKNEKDHKHLDVPAERSPADFFRRGKVGGWADDLPRAHVKIVETVCGELMQELGYQRVTAGDGRARIAIHDRLH
ncbi:MAG: sulfotransferase domain-containing protein [Vicinamibacteraceae bacterium]